MNRHEAPAYPVTWIGEFIEELQPPELILFAMKINEGGGGAAWIAPPPIVPCPCRSFSWVEHTKRWIFLFYPIKSSPLSLPPPTLNPPDPHLHPPSCKHDVSLKSSNIKYV